MLLCFHAFVNLNFYNQKQHSKIKAFIYYLNFMAQVLWRFSYKTGQTFYGIYSAAMYIVYTLGVLWTPEQKDKLWHCSVSHMPEDHIRDCQKCAEEYVFICFYETFSQLSTFYILCLDFHFKLDRVIKSFDIVLFAYQKYDRLFKTNLHCVRTCKMRDDKNL